VQAPADTPSLPSQRAFVPVQGPDGANRDDPRIAHRAGSGFNPGEKKLVVNRM
jgi:hypothetical protein